MVIGIGMRRSVGTLVTAALVLFLILTLEASPAAGASRTACRVTNTDSGRSYAALQAAVDAAGSGQTLIVRGTCHGTTVIGKDLVIQGVRTRRSGRPTLDGDGKDSVLTVRRVQVLIEDLTVQGGEMPRWLAPKGRRFGGGISNRGGTLVLRDVVVRRNRGKDGGGIFNTGALTLDGDTEITRNRSGYRGAIFNKGSLTLAATSRVSGNAGVGVSNLAVLVLNGHSSVRNNTGDGVQNWGLGTVTLNEDSSIWDNADDGVDNLGTLILNDASTIAWNLNGVYNSGTLTLNDESDISRHAGSGIYNSERGVVVVGGSSRIDANGIGRWVRAGHTVGGIHNLGTVTLNDSARVRRNMNWGVLQRLGGSLTMNGTSRITGNHGLGKRGGGVHAGTLTGVTCGPGGNVYGNTPDDCYIESP